MHQKAGACVGILQRFLLACRENREDFEGFLGEEFDAYTLSMAQVGTWGDELTLVSIKRIIWSLSRFV